MISAAAGALAAVAGVSRAARGAPSGLLLAAVGGGLLYRGLSGHCSVYRALGLSTAQHGPQASLAPGQGVKVEKSFTINKPPDELFKFWRNLENLPRFMRYLETVRTLDDKRSHWVAVGPLGVRVEWDAEIINEEPNELIAWRSLPGADVDNAGSVHFRRAPADRGTEVEVVLRYDPPGGSVGATIARLLGESPEQEIEEDLRRFKQLMETGEIPTTAGQPRGRCAM